MTDVATANATEKEKLKVIVSQSSEGFDPAKCNMQCVCNVTMSVMQVPNQARQ